MQASQAIWHHSAPDMSRKQPKTQLWGRLPLVMHQGQPTKPHPPKPHLAGVSSPQPHQRRHLASCNVALYLVPVAAEQDDRGGDANND